MSKVLCCAMMALVLSLGSSAVFADSLNFDSPLTGWSVDRFAPGTFAINSSAFPGNNVLELGIKGSDVQSNSFYNYQGMAHAFPVSGAVQNYSIDQYVNPNWAGQSINAGIWGVGVDSTNTISAYPIIAYRQSSTNAFVAGYYDFNYFTGNWESLTAGQTGWNNLSITLNVGTGVSYAVNGVTYGSIVDPDTTNLSSIILNSYNFGSDYSTYYDNFQSGTVVPLPRTAYAGVGLLGVLGIGMGLRRRKARLQLAPAIL